MLLIYCVVLLLSQEALSKNIDTFLSKKRSGIEKYMMTGYGGGWSNCDLLGDIPLEPSFMKDNGNFVLQINMLDDINVETTFSSSYCLLVHYNVVTNQSLSALINFGWEVSKIKRLGLVLKMGSGLSLDMATNTTKLPFFIAAQLEDGKEQFLCPLIGTNIPSLQHYICDQSYMSYVKKLLRV